MGFKVKFPNPAMWVSSIKAVIADTAKVIHMFTSGSYASVGMSSPLLWNPARVEQAFFVCAILSAVSSVLEILYNFQTYMFFGLLAPRLVTTAIVFVIQYALGCCIQLYHKWSVPAWVYFGIGVLGALSLVSGVFQIFGALGQFKSGIVYVVLALISVVNYAAIACLALDTFYDVVRGKLPFYDVAANKYVGRPFVDQDPFKRMAAINADAYRPQAPQAPQSPQAPQAPQAPRAPQQNMNYQQPVAPQQQPQFVQQTAPQDPFTARPQQPVQQTQPVMGNSQAGFYDPFASSSPQVSQAKQPESDDSDLL